MELLKLSRANIYHIFCKFLFFEINYYIVDHEKISTIWYSYTFGIVVGIVSFEVIITLPFFIPLVSSRIHSSGNVTLLVEWLWLFWFYNELINLYWWPWIRSCGSMNMRFWSNLLEFSSQRAEVPFAKYKLLLTNDPMTSLSFWFWWCINKSNTELLIYPLVVEYLSAYILVNINKWFSMWKCCLW